jgi:hypothetical protein
MAVIMLELKKCNRSGQMLDYSCPMLGSEPTKGAGCATDYYCMLANKPIAGYVEWESEMPEVPEWCPLRSDKEYLELQAKTKVLNEIIGSGI